MRTWVIAAALAGLVSLWAPSAFPCGGAFGQGMTFGAEQKIFVRHKDGIETYFFTPRFCGKSAAFGLILPIPATLSSEPQIGDTLLISQLEEVTQPSIQTEAVCGPPRAGSYGADASANGSAGSGSQGVTVVDKGQVGIFDWSLLKADSAAAFTDWLDANKYPYDANLKAPFQHYVDSGWYFVAFKVTADTQDPPANLRLCGSLGPLQLSFPTQNAVVPARITSASSPTSSYSWRLFVASDKQLTAPAWNPSLRYSGVVSASDLSNHTALSTVGIAENDWLTEFDVSFGAATINADIQLAPADKQEAYRRVIIQQVYKDCSSEEDDGGGCSLPARGSEGWVLGALVGLSALLVRRRRLRSNSSTR